MKNSAVKKLTDWFVYDKNKTFFIKCDILSYEINVNVLLS